MSGNSLESILLSIIRSLALHSPVILIEFIGLVLAIVYWRRLPPLGRLALPGFALMLFNSVVLTSCWAFLPQWLIENGYQIEVVYTLFSLISSLLSAVAIACLVGAIYFSRRPAPR